MSEDDSGGLGHRDLLRGLGAGVTVSALAAAAEATPADPAEMREMSGRTDPHTSATFGALVDAVIPRTPGLGIELGPEHEPGGLEVGLDDFLVTYVNTLFQHGAPGLGHLEDLRLAEAVAGVLDAGGAELLARDLNEHEPGGHEPEGEDWTAGGPFARLHREDRVRAIALFDEGEKEFETSELPGPVAEGDAGLVGQLVVSFTEVVYYSEWAGYEDGAGLTAPPSERAHPNTPEAVQSWRQTGYPRVADGYKALRGYVGRPDLSLGDDRVWTTISGGSPPTQITLGSGSFTDNEYDTSGYEEVFPEEDERSAHGPGGDAEADVDVENEYVDAGVEVDTGRPPGADQLTDGGGS